ncbi:hypothetical protein V5T82_14970 [Magnetovibrio sp. PR-2]|uniref:hypothetical protein n=1 Tax=Magnetovibrio sp. PR-2 TaxID=3120356 RepID=UPI002FCE3A03
MPFLVVCCEMKSTHRKSSQVSAMPNYSLQVEPGKVLFAVAKDRNEALAELGDQLGQALTFDDQDSLARYLLDEWENSPHWFNPTIPVFVLNG